MEVIILFCHPKGANIYREKLQEQLKGHPVMVIAWGTTMEIGIGFIALGWTGQASTEFTQSLDDDPRFIDYLSYTINLGKC